MARINFEDKLFKSPAFQKFMIKIGDRHKAMGQVLDLWSLAQKYWFPEKKLIPRKAFHESDLSEILIEVGLAEERDGSIYARGSEDQFQWLFQRQEAGKQSAKKKLKSPNSDSDQRPLTVVEPSPSEPERQPSSFLFSPSSSLITPSSDLSSQNSSLKNNKSFRGEKPPAEVVVIKPTNLIWEAYSKAYQDRWKEPPIRNKLVNSQLKQFSERIPVDVAPDVARFYVGHGDYIYVKAMHPTGLLLRDAEKLHTEFKTKTRMTSSKAKNAEQFDHAKDQLDRIHRGEL